MKGFGKNVTAAGTPEKLSSESLQVTSCVIQAKRSNTGNVYIGGSDVSSTTGTSLIAGQTYNLSLSGTDGLYDLQRLWLDVDTSGEGVTVTYFEN